MRNAQNPVQENIVGKYLNRHLWSDVHPIGKVIAMKGKSSAVVQKVEVVEGSNKAKMDFHVGGFSAHCSNNYSQQWEYKETEETFVVRLSKRFFKQVRVSDSPLYFYDFNF